MKKRKLYVLTELSQKNNEKPELYVLGVYPTKTAAKEKLSERKEQLEVKYEQDYPGNWDLDTDDPTIFEIYAEDAFDWTELLVTENEVEI